MSEILTPQQIEVITALSAGMTTIAAAAKAGVHRNTVLNWRRSSLPFADALAQAHYDHALLYREEIVRLAERAFETLQSLMTDPKASPSVRLKAALYVLQTATTAPAPRPETSYQFESAPEAATESVPEPEHNSAQYAHYFADSTVETVRRESPKVGRNETCPCGSGQKFKRCCLNKPHNSAQSQAVAA